MDSWREAKGAGSLTSAAWPAECKQLWIRSCMTAWEMLFTGNISFYNQSLRMWVRGGFLPPKCNFLSHGRPCWFHIQSWFWALLLLCILPNCCCCFTMCIAYWVYKLILWQRNGHMKFVSQGLCEDRKYFVHVSYSLPEWCALVKWNILQFTLGDRYSDMLNTVITLLLPKELLLLFS